MYNTVVLRYRPNTGTELRNLIIKWLCDIYSPGTIPVLNSFIFTIRKTDKYVYSLNYNEHWTGREMWEQLTWLVGVLWIYADFSFGWGKIYSNPIICACNKNTRRRPPFFAVFLNLLQPLTSVVYDSKLSSSFSSISLFIFSLWQVEALPMLTSRECGWGVSFNDNKNVAFLNYTSYIHLCIV
jgi:hypothetical protein